MHIKLDNLDSPEVVELLTEHLEEMSRVSPPESTHALDFEGLRDPGVTVWTAWEGDELLGFGALKKIDARHVEIKSMRTTLARRRQGVAARLLEHLLAEARRRGYRRISLETGSQDAFEAARELYARFGFKECEPFARYVEDPNSVFMTREL